MSIGRVPGVTGIQPSIVDAKGDLIVATAADSVDRLAVGTNNFRLVADSGESTGLKWQGFVGVSLYMSANQSIANNTEVKVLFDSEDYDTNGFHSTSSNTSRITIPTGLGGYYLFTANAAWNANAAGNRSMFYKINNTTYYMTWTMPSGVAALDMSLPGSIVIKLNAGDYVELGVYQSSGGALDLEGGINEETRYQATFLGA